MNQPKLNEGEQYAGITIKDGKPVHLILVPGEFEGEWQAAMDWAKERGGFLPSRIDHLVLLKNLRGEFKREWYWSNESFYSNDASAWGQYFGNGDQDYDRKSSKLRARAVRYVEIVEGGA